MSLSNWNVSKNSTAAAAPFLSEIGQTIDSTVRSLTSSNDSMVKSVLEQNKVLNDTIKTITDQMREMALVNRKLAETITDVTATNKKMIEELNTIRKENNEHIKEIKSELEAVRDAPSARAAPRDFVDASAATIYAGGQPSYCPAMQNQSFPLPPYQQQQQMYYPQQQQQQQFTRAQPQSSVYTNVPPSTSNNNNAMPFDQQQNLEFASYLYLAAQQQRQQELLQQKAHQQASQMPVQVTPAAVVHPQAPASAADVSATFTVPAQQQQQSAPSAVFPPQSKPKTPTTTTAPSLVKPVSGQTAPQLPIIVKCPSTKVVPAAAPAAPTFAELAAAKPAAATPPKTTAPSLFSGFSFAKSQTTATPTTTTMAVTPTSAVVAGKGFASPAGGIFGTLSSSSSTTTATSFGQVAASAAAKDEKKTTTSGLSAFAGAGQPVFGSKIQKSPSGDAKDENAGNDDEHEPFEPTIDFKPLVPLPALVEVKTGEEDEEVLFKERAKLYRFDQETKEFKERGLGDIKLLKNKQGRVRVLMRREQTLKLCANHYLSPQMKLLPLSKSDRAFTWQCNDFADNELKAETLAVKFKMPEMASKFKQVFEESVLSAESSSPQKSKTAGGEEKKSETTTTTSTGFGDKFKKAPGSWDCPSCCTNNGADKIACACCGTTKDGKTDAAAAKPTSQFGGFKFSTPPGAAAAAAPTPDGGPKISFGFGAVAGTPKTTATPTTTPALSFGFKTPNQQQSTIFGFATPTSSPATTTTTIFGKSSTNGDGKNDVIIVEDSTIATTAKSCPGCMGCSMSDAEIDKIFEKIDQLAKNGPQYPLEFNDDEYDDKNLMIEIDP